MRKRFLNGCAKSVVLAKAFEDAGWDAWTCDILPSEGWHKHIQDDVLKHVDDGWDMAIFHPNCTVLSLSGVRWIYERAGRLEEVEQAARFFNACRNAPIPIVVTENPIQHHFARQYIPIYDQIIQPWQFGDMETKATCLWLRGVPRLIPLITEKPDGVRASVWREPPSPERKANRARNFPGIARCMANQWG